MKLPASIGGLIVVAVVAMTAQDLPEWVLQLSRVKHQAKANFERIPNYVCREVVERFQRKPKSQVWTGVDTLRFDVARVGNKELLAVPGAGGFQDGDLSGLAPSGVMSTGAFSAIASTLFVADNARITPHQEEVGLPAGVRGFDYVVPAFLSGYEIVSRGQRATVGMRGTFWIDPESLDLIRIEEYAVDIPFQVGMSEADTTIDYARMRIGMSDVLLPRSADLVVTELDGGAKRNHIEFSGCREYQSESTVRFGDPMEPPPPAKKK